MSEKEFDIVIIGSGAGGGTVAQALAPLCRDGLRIAVLEWGPRLRDNEYTGRELEMVGRLYADGAGFFDQSRSMTVAMGRAYGGSTTVYTGTSLAVPAHVIAGWDVPGLSHTDLMERTERHKRELNVHDLEAHLINDNNKLFAEGCRKLGLDVHQFPVNIAGCRGSGLCNLGCPNQAKQGTHRVQLPQAERQGVEVISNCRVTHLAEGRLEAEVVEASVGEPSPWAPGRYRIAARIIVLAAGAVHSPALLLRSGFGPSLPALGRYFTCHPALTLVARHSRPISNFHGFPKSYYCDSFERSHRFLLETCMYFPFTTAKSFAGFGPEHSRFMADFRKLQMILVLAADPAVRENRVAVDRAGEPVLHYHFADAVLDAYVLAQKTAARIFFAAGAECVHLPAASKFTIERAEESQLDTLVDRRFFKLGKVSIASAHPMGGCRMGPGPADSVTDAWGQVHGHPGLFVADASLFPKCLEVNPYLTVMALADRTAEAVRRKLAT